jgi:hypothetical protein
MLVEVVQEAFNSDEFPHHREVYYRDLSGRVLKDIETAEISTQTDDSDLGSVSSDITKDCISLFRIEKTHNFTFWEKAMFYFVFFLIFEIIVASINISYAGPGLPVVDIVLPGMAIFPCLVPFSLFPTEASALRAKLGVLLILTAVACAAPPIFLLDIWGTEICSWVDDQGNRSSYGNSKEYSQELSQCRLSAPVPDSSTCYCYNSVLDGCTELPKYGNDCMAMVEILPITGIVLVAICGFNFLFALGLTVTACFKVPTD